MINTAAQLASVGEEGQKCVSIRTALPGSGGDLKFIDHLQKQYSKQLGFLPTVALEKKIEMGQVSLALENDEPAAYILGNGNYLRDPHFGIIYQAAVSYDARRRLMGTALVQHFIDHAPGVCDTGRLIGLWCAQDIEANEFWNHCGFEAIAARHGSRKKGRVHIFWVGRTPRGAHEPLRYPRYTRGGLMREMREVFGIEPGSEYTDVELPELEQRSEDSGQRSASKRKQAGRLCHRKQDLADAQRAFRYGQGKHICVVIAGLTKYLPVAPFDLPDFTDVARIMVAAPGTPGIGEQRSAVGGRQSAVGGPLWTPAAAVESLDS